MAKQAKTNKLIIPVSIIFLLIVVFLIFIVLNKASVSGKIVDSSDKSTIITGVTIKNDGSIVNTNNSITGTFLVNNIKPGKHTLTFSREGFKDYNIEINPGIQQNINMQVELEKLNEKVQSSGTKMSYIIPDSNTLIISEPDLNKTNTVEVSERPSDIVAIPEKNKIYSSSISQGVISVVSTISTEKIKDISFDQKYQLKKLILSPTKDKLYVLTADSGKLLIVDTSTDSLISTIEIDRMTFDITVNPTNGNILVLSNSSLETLSASGASLSSYKFSKGDFYGNVVAIYNQAFVIHSTDHFLIAVNTIENSEKKIDFTKTIRAIRLDNNYVYLLFNDSISVMRVSDSQMVKQDIMTPGKDNKDFIISKDGTKIYIIDSGSKNISVFDVATMSISDKTINTSYTIRKLTEL